MFKLIYRPEKDYEFSIGDKCVLNSGSPLLTVVGINKIGDRLVSWVDGSGEIQYHRFPSIFLRPNALHYLKIDI